MEITIAFFWLAKLVYLLLTLFCIYKFVKTKNKTWVIIWAILVFLAIVSPVKMDTGTKARTDYMNHAIKEQKVLPEKIENNTFKQSTENLGISPTDLK